MRFPNENEYEKISKELLNKLIPLDVLSEYYCFGFAGGLHYIKAIIERSRFLDSEQEEKLLKLIDNAGTNQDDIKIFYNKLGK